MEKEIWKNIVGYEGYYQASNTGKIKSLDRFITSTNGKTQFRCGSIMKQRKNKKGYKTVRLSKNGEAKNKFVHVLVLESFEKRPHGLTQINHKDENKENNNLTNLEYCTNYYNQNYGSCSANKSKATINDIRKSKKVIQLTKEGTVVRHFPSLHEVERVYGFQHGHIRDACNGKLHTAYGYLWEWGHKHNIIQDGF